METLSVDEGTLGAPRKVGPEARMNAQNLAAGSELSHWVPSRASGELGVSCTSPHPTAVQVGSGVCATCGGMS